MKYKATLLNISSALLLIWGNYTYWTTGYKGDTEGWGMLALMTLSGAGLFGLLIDFVLQKLISNYWLITGIELLIISTVLIYSLLS
jgi:hypothetical protein